MIFGRSMFVFLGFVCILKKKKLVNVFIWEGEGWDEGFFVVSKGDLIVLINRFWYLGFMFCRCVCKLIFFFCGDKIFSFVFFFLVEWGFLFLKRGVKINFVLLGYRCLCYFI